MEQTTHIASLINFNGNSELPAWIHIMQAGIFIASDGRGPWHLKDPAAVIQASMRPKVDMVIDRDHELIDAPPGTQIPAAGWIKEIENRLDGLWARVEWTDIAKAQILAKEYRYISPVFKIVKGTGEITKILHVSLVNSPAMELTAVASKQLNHKTTPTTEKKKDYIMDEKETLTAIAKVLGLENADDLAVLVETAKANIKSVTALETEIASIRTALGLKEGADNAEIIETASKKIATNTPDPKEYVPMSMFEETQQTLASMQKSLTEDKASQVVTAAVKSGHVTPAQKDWAMEYAKKDLEGFNQYVSNAPQILAEGKKEDLETASKKNKSSDLSAEDIKVAKMMGVSVETLKDTD